MNRGPVLLWLAGALLLTLLGLVLPGEGLRRLLDPETAGDRAVALDAGIRVFRANLVVLGAVCVVGAAFFRWPRPVTPLWRPPAVDRDLDGAGVMVVGVIAAAAALRWIGLGWDLWLDEVYTLVDFVRLPVGRILTDYSNDNQHLAYTLLARASVGAFGESPAAVRLPALLFGLASLWALYRLVRLVGGTREALLATALLAFSYHHIWFSQNARGYTGLLFTTVLSTELFLRGAWRGRWRIWCGYAVVVAFGMALHLTMVFVAAAHGLVALGLGLRAGPGAHARWRPLAGLLMAGALTVQIYALVVPQMLEFFTRPGGGTLQAEIAWKNPMWLVTETLRGLGVGLAFGLVGVAAAGGLAGAGLVRLVRRDPVSACLFVLPPLLGGVTLLVLGRNLWPRFFFNCFGFAALLAVSGAWALGELAARRFGNRPAAGMALAGLLVLASAATLPRVYSFPKQDFSGARDFVHGARGEGDRVVAVGLAADAYARYYAPAWPGARTADELAAAAAGADRTWVVYTLTTHLGATQPDLARVLEADYETVKVFPGTLGDGTIIVRRSIDRYPSQPPEEAQPR